MIVGIGFTLHHSYRNSHYMKRTETDVDGRKVFHIELAQEVSFFNKASIIAALEAVPNNAKVIIDCSNSKSISYDVVEFIRDYPLHAKLKNIDVETIAFIVPKA
jgi:SulP family sulfate permease